MKGIYACTIIGSILMSAVVNTTAAQALPSEKPAMAYYSKPVAQNMAAKKAIAASAAAKQRSVLLPSEKARLRASLPGHLQQKAVARTRNNPAAHTDVSVLPSNKGADMVRIRKQKALANRQ